MGHHHGHHPHGHHHRSHVEKPFKPGDTEREVHRAMEAARARAQRHATHVSASTGGASTGGGASDMAPGIAMIGLVFLVLLGALAVSALGLTSAIELGAVGLIALVAIGLVVGASVRSARAREAAEAAAERDEAARVAAIAASPPTLVTLMLEVVSSSRGELGRFSQGTSAYVTLTELVEALRGKVGSASLRGTGPLAAGADPLAAVHGTLEALAARDVRSAEAGYRDGAPTHSTPAPGSVIVAVAVAVRGAGPLAPVSSLDTLRAALESLFPIESQTAAFALRVVPEGERALSWDAVRALFPELVPLSADPPDPRTLSPR
jgi:hypothetical protein